MPSIIEPRRRIDRALWAVVMEAYVAGVSTRSVDDLVAALGAESGISKSEVSRICPSLDERVEAFRIGICWPRRGMGGEGDVRATPRRGLRRRGRPSAPSKPSNANKHWGAASTSSPPTRHQAVPQPVPGAASIPSTAGAVYRLGYGA